MASWSTTARCWHIYRRRGFAMSDEAQRAQVPATPLVLITAHGVSERERARLAEAGKKLVDTTCPLVIRAHEAAQRLRRDGRFVIVVGRRGHVEVEGIVGDLDPGEFSVVESAEEVVTYPSERLGIVCQTTAAARLVATVRSAVAAPIPTRTSRSRTPSACPPKTASEPSTTCWSGSRPSSWSAVATRTTPKSWPRDVAPRSARAPRRIRG